MNDIFLSQIPHTSYQIKIVNKAILDQPVFQGKMNITCSSRLKLILYSSYHAETNENVQAVIVL